MTKKDGEIVIGLEGEGDLKKDTQKATGAVDDLKQSVDKTSQSQKNAARTGKEAGDKSAEGAKKASTQWIELYAKVQLGAQAFKAVGKTLKFISDLGREGATDKMLGEAAQRNFGNTARALDTLREATKRTVTDTDLLSYANRLARAGFSLDEVTSSMKAARFMAADLGKSFGETMGMITRVGETGALGALQKVLGATTNDILNQIKAYEKINGTMLTAERGQMALRLGLIELKKVRDKSNISDDLAIDKYDALSTAMGNLKSNIGAVIDQDENWQAFLKSSAGGVGVLERGLVRATKRTGTLLKTLTALLTPGAGIAKGLAFYDDADVPDFEGPTRPSPGDVSITGGQEQEDERAKRLKNFAEDLNKQKVLDDEYIARLQRNYDAEKIQGDKADAIIDARNAAKRQRAMDQMTWDMNSLNEHLIAVNDTKLQHLEQIVSLEDQVRAYTLEQEEEAKAEKLRIQKETLEASKSLNAQWSAVISNQIHNMLSQSAMALGEFFVNVSSDSAGAGKKMLGTLLGMFATFAQTMGALFIATGIGLLNLQALSGPGLIVGGVLLLAAAGALRAAVGKLKGGGSGSRSGSVSSSAPQGGSRGDSTPPPLSPVGNASGQAGQNITYITIQGVIGGADTSRAILGLVNEHAGKSAPRINRGAIEQS